MKDFLQRFSTFIFGTKKFSSQDFLTTEYGRTFYEKYNYQYLFNTNFEGKRDFNPPRYSKAVIDNCIYVDIKLSDKLNGFTLGSIRKRVPNFNHSPAKIVSENTGVAIEYVMDEYTQSGYQVFDRGSLLHYNKAKVLQRDYKHILYNMAKDKAPKIENGICITYSIGDFVIGANPKKKDMLELGVDYEKIELRDINDKKIIDKYGKTTDIRGFSLKPTFSTKLGSIDYSEIAKNSAMLGFIESVFSTDISKIDITYSIAFKILLGNIPDICEFKIFDEIRICYFDFKNYKSALKYMGNINRNMFFLEGFDVEIRVKDKIISPSLRWSISRWKKGIAYEAYKDSEHFSGYTKYYILLTNKSNKYEYSFSTQEQSDIYYVEDLGLELYTEELTEHEKFCVYAFVLNSYSHGYTDTIKLRDMCVDYILYIKKKSLKKPNLVEVLDKATNKTTTQEQVNIFINSKKKEAKKKTDLKNLDEEDSKNLTNILFKGLIDINITPSDEIFKGKIFDGLEVDGFWVKAFVKDGKIMFPADEKFNLIRWIPDAVSSGIKGAGDAFNLNPNMYLKELYGEGGENKFLLNKYNRKENIIFTYNAFMYYLYHYVKNYNPKALFENGSETDVYAIDENAKNIADLALYTKAKAEFERLKIKGTDPKLFLIKDAQKVPVKSGNKILYYKYYLDVTDYDWGQYAKDNGYQTEEVAPETNLKTITFQSIPDLETGMIKIVFETPIFNTEEYQKGKFYYYRGSWNELNENGYAKIIDNVSVVLYNYGKDRLKSFLGRFIPLDKPQEHTVALNRNSWDAYKLSRYWYSVELRGSKGQDEKIVAVTDKENKKTINYVDGFVDVKDRKDYI